MIPYNKSCIDAIISETMKAANKLVKDRKKGTVPQQKAPPAQKKTGKMLENRIICCFVITKYFTYHKIMKISCEL